MALYFLLMTGAPGPMRMQSRLWTGASVPQSCSPTAAGWVTRSQAYDCLDILLRQRRYVRPADPEGYDRLVERLLCKKRGSGCPP